MNTYDRFIRSQQIIALHRAGVPHKDISAQFGISVRQVDRIVKEVEESELAKQQLQKRLDDVKQDLEDRGWLS